MGEVLTTQGDKCGARDNLGAERAKSKGAGPPLEIPSPRQDRRKSRRGQVKVLGEGWRQGPSSYAQVGKQCKWRKWVSDWRREAEPMLRLKKEILPAGTQPGQGVGPKARSPTCCQLRPWELHSLERTTFSSSYPVSYVPAVTPLQVTSSTRPQCLSAHGKWLELRGAKTNIFLSELDVTPRWGQFVVKWLILGA